MAVASEESPTMISDDDIMPPTPSDASDDDGLTAAEVLDKLEKVQSVVPVCSVVAYARLSMRPELLISAHMHEHSILLLCDSRPIIPMGS